MRKKQEKKSEANFYQISAAEDQYLQNQYQYVSKTNAKHHSFANRNNSDYNYIDDGNIQNIYTDHFNSSMLPTVFKNTKKIPKPAPKYCQPKTNNIVVIPPGLSHIQVSHI